jgi:hypothetical protein
VTDVLCTQHVFWLFTGILNILLDINGGLGQAALHCTTELTDGLSVFPCLAVPHSIIRYQRVKRSVLVLCLKHELPVQAQHTSTQQCGVWHYMCIFYIIHAHYMYVHHGFDKKGKG